MAKAAYVREKKVENCSQIDIFRRLNFYEMKSARAHTPGFKGD